MHCKWRTAKNVPARQQRSTNVTGCKSAKTLDVPTWVFFHATEHRAVNIKNLLRHYCVCAWAVLRGRKWLAAAKPRLSTFRHGCTCRIANPRWTKKLKDAWGCYRSFPARYVRSGYGCLMFVLIVVFFSFYFITSVYGCDKEVYLRM